MSVDGQANLIDAPLEKDQAYPSTAWAWYTVAILLCAYIFSFIDRQILNLLVAPVRRDLGITDTEMSLLIGFSFAVFYSVLGLPFGRLADSVSRPRLIIVGMFTWSLMTGGCGLINSYAQLFILRMGVGVGEATLSPAAVFDDFRFIPSRQTLRAIQRLHHGHLHRRRLRISSRRPAPPLLRQQANVRASRTRTRPSMASPLHFPRNLRHSLHPRPAHPSRSLPQRRASFRERPGKNKVERIALSAVWKYFVQNKKALLSLNVGMGLAALAAYGTSAWGITFLVRNHHMTASHAGIVFGTAQIFAGTLGMLTAGKAVAWLAKRGYRDAYMRVAVFAAAAWLIPGILFPARRRKRTP